MERNKLVLDLNKNKEFNYIYKLTEEQIFSKLDRKSTRLNSSHIEESRMPSSA